MNCKMSVAKATPCQPWEMGSPLPVPRCVLIECLSTMKTESLMFCMEAGLPLKTAVVGLFSDDWQSEKLPEFN